MKNLLGVIGSVAVIALLGSTAWANDANRNPVEMCGTMGELAEAVMTARQAGVTMSKAMTIVGQDASIKDDNLRSIATDLVMAAYDSPQYSVESNRRDATVRFRNDFEVKCFKSLMR